MLGSAGSYLDGGTNAPLQRLALPLMELDFIRKDTWALQRHFRTKRDFLLEKLSALGIKVQWSELILLTGARLAILKHADPFVFVAS